MNEECPTVPGPPAPRRRRRWWLPAGGFLAAAVLAAGGAVWFVRWRDRPPVPPEVAEDEREPAVAAVIRKARQRVLVEPRSAKAWGDLGEVFIANDRENESFTCFAQAERLDPANPRWPYFQAGPLLNRGDREAALPYLERAARRCDAAAESNPVPRLMLAETLLTLGRLDEAEAQFRRVQEQQPDQPRTLFDLGLLAAARQDWPAARDRLLRCVNHPQTRQRACAQLAAVCQRLGAAAEADRYRDLAERLARDPDWNDPFVTEYLNWAVKKKNRYRLAENLETAGRLDEAIKVLEPMTAEYPDDYLPRVTLAKLLGRTGGYQRAEQAMREAVRLAPDKVQVHYYLGLVLYMEGEDALHKNEPARASERFREAADLARQALAMKPDYGFAHMVRGLSLKRLGHPAEALASLRQAVRCNPEHAELHFHLGELLADDHQVGEARHHLEQALQLAPPGAHWCDTARHRLQALQGAVAPKGPATPGG